MPGRLHKQREPRVVVRKNTRTEVMADSRTHRKRTRAAVELDSILDEIDSLLEENAEEFVKNFVQRGGE